MDALYLFRHSVYGDVEIRYSLRSVAKYAPYIRKVWIFGDRPALLSDETSLIEHVPHSYITRSGSFRTPVSNTFLMLYLSSLIPELDSEYFRVSDDYFSGSSAEFVGGCGQELCCQWSAFFLPHTAPAEGEGGVGEKKCWWDAASSGATVCSH